MRELFIINDTTENRISYYHLLAFLAALPFDRFYSQLVLFSLIVHSLIHLKKKNLRFTVSGRVLIPAAVFLLNLVALIYSKDKNNAMAELVRQSPILIFPVLFVLLEINPGKYIKKLLIFFSLVCSLTVLYLFTDAIIIIIQNNLPLRSLFLPGFMNHNFSASIGMHATYLSMYVALCFVSCLYFFITTGSTRQRWGYGFAILVLGAGLAELSSRSVLIAVCIIIAVFPFVVLEKKAGIHFFLISVAAMFLVFLGILEIDSLKTRYISELRSDLGEPDARNFSEPRLARWKCAMELIKKSPVIGYGGGTEKKLLREIYFERKLFISYLNALDAHNQYLSFLIKTGMAGLAVFLFVLFCGFRDALRRKNMLFTAFMILITIVSVSENILDVNKGIFFFGFFFALFFVRRGNSEN